MVSLIHRSTSQPVEAAQFIPPDDGRPMNDFFKTLSTLKGFRVINITDKDMNFSHKESINNREHFVKVDHWSWVVIARREGLGTQVAVYTDDNLNFFFDPVP